MKEKKKLSELTLEELIKKKNQSKGVAIGLGIVIIIAVIVLVMLALKTENYALITVGLSSLIAILPMFIAFKEINDEIKSRK